MHITTNDPILALSFLTLNFPEHEFSLKQNKLNDPGQRVQRQFYQKKIRGK